MQSNFPTPESADLEVLVARTQAIGVEVLDVFDAFRTLAAEVAEAVSPHLPDGTELEDSFVGAIAEAIDQELTPAQLDPLEDAVTLLSSDTPGDQVLLLEDLWFTSKHQATYAKRMLELCRATADSLEGLSLVARRQAGVEGSMSTAQHAAASDSALEAVLSRARNISLHCMMVQQAAAKVSAEALSFLARGRWNALQQELGEHVLDEVWNAIVQGRLHVDELEDAGLDVREAQLVSRFVEETAAYLSQELMRAKQSDAEEPTRAKAEDTDVAVIPPKFCVKLHYPDPVRVGDTLTLRIVARNDHLVPVVLDTIDIEHTFLDGFVVDDIVPRPSEQRTEADEMTLAFDAAVDALGAMEVRLTLRAMREGNFAGEVRVWTDEIEDAVAMPNIDVIGAVQ